MFQPRIIRADDALLIFETFAFLIRQYGPPQRPAVPSPLHKSPGLETLVHDPLDGREVFDWAQDSYATVCDAMNVDAAEFRFIASVEPKEVSTHLPNLLSYDPRHCAETGRFVAQLIIDICERKCGAFDPGFTPSPFQTGIIKLCAAAYFRQGFVLTHLPQSVQQALRSHDADAPMAQRFIDNTLVFAACTALCVNRQSPEQIIATYGSILPKHIRKKVNVACRQIEGFTPEIKLLRIMGEKQPVRPRGRIRPELQAALRAQPQRISWT